MVPTADSPESVRIAFVCVQNAGRSQIAYAFGQHEISQRELESEIDLVTGGTRPADHVHEEVVDVMSAVDIDIADQTPREITFEETQESDYVITMGCSANDVCPAGWAGENRDWDLGDPDSKSPDEVAAIRDEIAQRVSDLFDEIETAAES
jgi:arsenate reductase